MLEILVVMATIYAIMAAKRSGNNRRRMRGYRKLPVDAEALGGTVAADDVTSTLFTPVLTESRRITSAVLTWAWHDITVGDGPIVVGLAHSDYTAAEIEECLEAAGAWDEGDKVAQEQAKRLVREVGTFSDGTTDQELNDGKPIKTKLNWLLATGDTLQTFIWNRGAALTTGSEVVVTGHLNSFLV